MTTLAISRPRARPPLTSEPPQVPPDGTTARAWSAAQRVVDDWLAMRRASAVGDARVRVLEAGCGGTTQLDLPPDVELTGLDISAAQLERHPRLVRRLLGDVQSHDFRGETFDIVICWNVLEHVARPDAGLRTLLAATAPGGLTIVAVPNLWSVKGLVTRWTPFRVHYWYYRYVHRDPSVGTTATLQFPTVLHPAVGPRRLQALAESLGVTVRFARCYVGSVQEALYTRSRLARVVFTIVGALSRFVTGGRYDLALSDAILILQPPHSGRAARPSSLQLENR
jgi:SAM-dependent methyltransferase